MVSICTIDGKVYRVETRLYENVGTYVKFVKYTSDPSRKRETYRIPWTSIMRVVVSEDA
jgi:hypothetical protein